MSSLPAWTRLVKSSASGANDFVWRDCRQEVLKQGWVAEISGAIIWRWLSSDVLCPWRYRSWIFPRDPSFLQKASPILDLYQGLWEGKPLRPNEHVRPSMRIPESRPVGANTRVTSILSRPAYVEHEYERAGAWVYLAAWDVHRAKVFGRCEAKNGIASFDRLVEEVMRQDLYRSATRVFWIMDNCSTHRGAKSVQRLQAKWPAIIPVHTPVHASWLNQVEIYFSIIQRNVLMLNDFASLTELNTTLFAFQQRYEKSAVPFQWTFTRTDLAALLARLKAKTKTLAPAA